MNERIYRLPPSLVIGTAEKLAIIAYRPAAGALFGRRIAGGQSHQHVFPPGMVIQDELHLISGPLGAVYALYEGIFERLCSFKLDGHWIKPKLIASTATIRGASDQVKALYARQSTSLFPAPGLLMGDSFFGTYARDDSGRLLEGLFDPSAAALPTVAQPPADPESDLLAFRRAEFNINRNEVNDPANVPNLRVIRTNVPPLLSPWFHE